MWASTTSRWVSATPLRAVDWQPISVALRSVCARLTLRGYRAQLIMPPKGKGSGLNDKKGRKGRGSSGKGARSASPNQLAEQEMQEGEQQRKRARRSGKEKIDASQELLHNPRGRSRMYWEMMQFLFVVFSLVNLTADGTLQRFADKHKDACVFSMIDSSEDYHKALKPFLALATKLFHMNREKAHSAFKVWLTEGQIEVNENKRGLGSPEYNLEDARSLKPQHLASIDSFIAKCHGPGGSGRVTIQTIRQHLKKEFSPDKMRTREQKSLVIVDVKRGVVRYALVNFLNYHWGKVKPKKNDGDPRRPTMIRTYLKAYADALQKEAAGTHVIVYTDEVRHFILKSLAKLASRMRTSCAELSASEPRPSGVLVAERRRRPRRPHLWERSRSPTLMRPSMRSQTCRTCRPSRSWRPSGWRR